MQLLFILSAAVLSVVFGRSSGNESWGINFIKFDVFNCSTYPGALKMEHDSQRVLNLVDLCKRVEKSKKNDLECDAPAKFCSDLGVNVTGLHSLNETCLMNRTPEGYTDERCEKICKDENYCRKPLSCSCGVCRLECVAERVCGEKEFSYYFEIYKQLAEFDLNADENFDSCKTLHQFKYNVSTSTSEPLVTNTGEDVELGGQGTQSGANEGTTPKMGTAKYKRPISGNSTKPKVERILINRRPTIVQETQAM